MRRRGPSSDCHNAKYLCIKYHCNSVVKKQYVCEIVNVNVNVNVCEIVHVAHVAGLGDFPSIPATLTFNEGLQNMHDLNGRAKNCLSTKFVHTRDQNL